MAKNGKEQVFVGIDPGATGAIAIISGGNIHYIEHSSIKPELFATKFHQIIAAACDPDNAVIAVERVSPFFGASSKSSFTFGFGFGIICGSLASLGYKFNLVSPKEWKANILFGTQKDKLAAIQFVDQRFPGVLPDKKTVDGIADAICIAEYCRRLNGTDNPV